MVAITVPSVAAPAIRMSAANPMPSCVTPDRLMAFLIARNPRLDPRFNDIARWYKYWGEAWRVRWDYAFFQMALETNYLSYRRPDGRRGDVHERQNNFAGIGATGGGVPGNRFPDMATGVHAQIQHLVAYSGERLAQPIAPRTELAQDDIIAKSQALRRDVTFGDLARRWAVDRNYARSIDAVAAEFRSTYCSGNVAASSEPASSELTSDVRTGFVPRPQPAKRQRRDTFAPPSGLGGPKRNGLAGPQMEDGEDLPWATKTTPAPSSAAKLPLQPAKLAPKPTQKNVQQNNTTRGVKPIVRTIWTRDRTTNRDVGSPSSAAVTQPRPAAATEAATSSIDNAAAPDENSFFSLPSFRISPQPVQPPSRLGGPVPTLVDAAVSKPACRVVTASYGGRKTLLVRSTIDGQMRLTALTVHDGFEKSMFETYAKAAAPGAELISAYETQAEALQDAHMNCDR